ncbi:MAG: hypothetical protein KDA99_05225 [Planctomycetales bacterium]|nr:hypothetical protein [Planctomycetales bacterium]
MAAVLALIGWEPRSHSGAQLRGACPVHQSSNPRSRSFSVNIDTHMFQCFSCGSKGNQLDLWQAFTGSPLYDAALELCQATGIEVPYLSSHR